MAGFFLTNSNKLSQVSTLVNLTDPSLRFGLEKETKTTKNTVQGELRLYTHVKISA